MKYSKNLIAVIIVLFAAASVYIKNIDAQSDKIPPVISDISIVDISETGAKIKWKTDESSDSIVNFSIDRNYGTVRNPNLNEKEHEVLLDNLRSSTTYFFRVISMDSSGNQSISGDFSFITGGRSDIEGLDQVKTPEDKSAVERAIAELEKLNDIYGFEVVQEKLRELAKGITNDLTIIGAPEVEIGTTTAVISWTTDRNSDSTVEFSPENLYTPGDYLYSQSDIGANSTRHTVELIGLEPFTLYHFQVVSKDQFDIVGRSDDRTFITKALTPEIVDPKIIKVEETAATFQWDTTIPSSALIEYEDLSTGIKNSIGSPTLVTNHLLKVAGLRLGAQYSAVIIAENESSIKVKSDPIYFITVKDESAPIISKVSNESTIFPGAEARIQTIVSWQTDEPSQCLFYYRQGLAPGLEELSLPPQDNNFLEKHVQVIVDFTPSTVYMFWVVCKDGSENESRSEDFVLFTPEKEKSIIDVILENFEGAFGWVKDIGA